MLDGSIRVKRKRERDCVTGFEWEWAETQPNQAESKISSQILKLFQITTISSEEEGGNPEDKKKRKLWNYKRCRKCLKTSVSVGTQIAENPN